MRNLKVTLEYDGTPYYGFQYQPGLPTVQGSIEQAWSRVLSHPVRVYAAGRTDAGVHAEGQVVSFYTSFSAPASSLMRTLNAFLPESITVKRVEEVPLEFHARFWAKRRVYEYRILENTERSSLWKYRWFCSPDSLDLNRLEEAAKLFLGRHNFYSFCAGGTPRPYAEKNIHDILIKKNHSALTFRFEAPSFLPRMVRMIAAAMLSYARGSLPRDTLQEYLNEAQKKFAHTLPPWGLYLVAVHYEE